MLYGDAVCLLGTGTQLWKTKTNIQIIMLKPNELMSDSKNYIAERCLHVASKIWMVEYRKEPLSDDWMRSAGKRGEID